MANESYTGRTIAILGTRGIPAQYGGFETFAEELGAGLAAAGYSVTVYCERTSDQSISPQQYRGIRLKHIWAPRLGPFSTIAFDLLCLIDAMRRDAVLYVLGYSASPFFVIPRLFGATVWVNMDGVEWSRKKWGGMARAYIFVAAWFAVRTANRVIVDAKAMSSVLRDSFGQSLDCTFIPYGANIRKAAPCDCELPGVTLQSRKYFLVVCRLEPENNLEMIVRGFANANLEIPLIVVGNPPAGSSFLDHLKRAAPTHRIHFVGGIYDQGKLAALRENCLCYLHGHSVGGTNPSLLEALACGNSVIAHDNPFNREVAGACASYFSDASDVSNLCKRASQESLSTIEERAMLARARIVQQYTWSDVVSRYAALLDGRESS